MSDQWNAPVDPVMWLACADYLHERMAPALLWRVASFVTTGENEAWCVRKAAHFATKSYGNQGPLDEVARCILFLACPHELPGTSPALGRLRKGVVARWRAALGKQFHPKYPMLGEKRTIERPEDWKRYSEDACRWYEEHQSEISAVFRRWAEQNVAETGDITELDFGNLLDQLISISQRDCPPLSPDLT